MKEQVILILAMGGLFSFCIYPDAQGANAAVPAGENEAAAITTPGAPSPDSSNDPATTQVYETPDSSLYADSQYFKIKRRSGIQLSRMERGLSEFSFQWSGLNAWKRPCSSSLAPTIFVSDFSYGRFLNRNLQVGGVLSWSSAFSSPFRNIGVGYYGVFIACHFQEDERDRLVPYLGAETAFEFSPYDYLHDPSIELFAGIKRFVSTGDAALSARAFIMEKWSGQSYLQYGLGFGISVFR